MQPRTVIASGLLIALVAACAWAVDLPTDEATRRKRLAEWQADPEHWARLQTNLIALRQMPDDDVERLRQLDKAIHDLDQTGQSRMRSVMERYGSWLARLSPADQAAIAAAPAGTKRIKVVDDILERQWVEALPKPDRDKLAKADAADRAKLLEQLHKEDDERRKLRQTARRTVEDSVLFGSLPNQSEFKESVQLFVEESLRPLANPVEEVKLNTSNRRPQWMFYFQTVLDIAETKGPIPFPGPAAPGSRKKAIRYWKDVPTEIVSRFTPSDLSTLPSYVTSAEGKWPDLPLAVVNFANEKNVTIPTKLLGPTKAIELPPSVQKFLKDELLPKLSDGDKSDLAGSEGKWPDYPKKVKELADKAKLRVPGLTLPGDKEVWRNIKNFKPGQGRIPPGP